MAGSDKEAGAAIPSWQQAASTADPSHSSSETASEGSTLEQARKFLQDEEVRLSNKEKKTEFLKSKGIEEADIHQLLEEAETTAAATQTTAKEEEHAKANPTNKVTVATAPEPQQDTRPDHPPIITYPEFLTKPVKPPPLITASGLLNSLGVVAGLSSLVYGATRYLVSPMVENLNEARTEFHENANKNLSRLLEKLEQTVSEIPPSYHAVGTGKRLAIAEPRSAEDTDYDDDDDDAGSSPYDDPTELFHRDVGVQTDPPPSSPSYSASTPGAAHGGWPPNMPTSNNTNDTNNTNGPEQEANRLNSIISSVRDLSGALISQADGLVGTKDVLDRFGEDLRALTYPPEYFGAGGSFVYGRSGAAPPDDEITRVKNNIRGVKGVLLSTRSFPAGTR